MVYKCHTLGVRKCGRGISVDFLLAEDRAISIGGARLLHEEEHGIAT